MDGRILLGKVDCTEEVELCRRYFLPDYFLLCKLYCTYCVIWKIVSSLFFSLRLTSFSPSVSLVSHQLKSSLVVTEQ